MNACLQSIKYFLNMCGESRRLDSHNCIFYLAENPDSISISLVNHTGAMVDSKEYQLLCEVQNVAPVQYLTLRWYRGQTEVYNNTFFELSPTTPVQVSSTLLISPSRAEDGTSYSCEATLELGPEGPQPSPSVKSGPFGITVYCMYFQTSSIQLLKSKAL